MKKQTKKKKNPPVNKIIKSCDLKSKEEVRNGKEMKEKGRKNERKKHTYLWVKRDWKDVPQIEVTFDISSDGMDSVSAKDKKTGKVETRAVGGQNLSKKEVEKYLQEIEKYREDKKFKKNAETFNRAETYCYTFKKQMEEFRKNENFKEDDPQFTEFKKLYDELKKLTDKKDKSEI